MASETSPVRDTSPEAKAKRDKITIAVAVIGVVIGYLTLRRATSASSTANQTTAAAGYSYPVIGQAGTGYAYGESYGGTSSDISGLSDSLAAISQQISTLSGAVTPVSSTSSPISSTGTVPTAGTVGSSGGPQPVKSSGPSIPGWELIATPQQGSAYYSAGRTIDYLPGGMAPSASNLLPFTAGGKTLAKPAPGGSEWLKVS